MRNVQKLFAALALLMPALTAAQSVPTPTIISPPSGAVDVELSPVLSWSMDPSWSAFDPDIAYHVVLFTTSPSATLFDTTVTFPAKSVKVGPLDKGVTYHWLVVAKYLNISSEAGGGQFTTVLPGAPVVIALPPNNDTVSPLFQWYDTNSASIYATDKTYRIQVSTDPAFPAVTAPYLMQQDFIVSNQPTQDLPEARRVGPLLPSTVYYWRIQRFGPGAGDFSAKQSFTTQAPPASKITWLSPQGAVNADGIPTLSWRDDGPNPASKFHLMVATDNTFPPVPPTASPSSPYVFNDIVTGTQQDMVLQKGTTYYWKIFVPLSEGGNGSFSTGSFATLPDPPGVTTLKSPAEFAQNVFPDQVFSWHQTDRAETYRAQIAPNDSFTTGMKEITGSDSSGTFPGLLRNTSYYWRVRGENGGGAGQWSNLRLLSTVIAPPAKPVVLFPDDGAVNQPLPAGFSWALASVDGWHIQVATDTGFTHLVHDDSTNIAWNQIGTEAAGLDSGVAYYWRLRSKNVGGVSEWSDRRMFVTIGHIPRQIAPAFGADQQPPQPAFKWTKVASASSYGLKIERIDFQSGGAQTYTVVTNITSGISDTVYTPSTPLQAGQVYRWYAGAATALETSWSQYVVFTTAAGAPLAPLPILPAQDSQGVMSAFAQFQWMPQAPDAAHGFPVSYRMQIALDTSFANPVFDTTMAGSTFSLNGRLAKATRFYWRVQGASAAGPSSWSARFTFVTAPDLPTAPIIVAPLYGSDSESTQLTLRWKPVPYVQKYVVKLITFVDTVQTVILLDTLADTARAVGPLLLDKFYLWTVTAVNAAGTIQTFGSFRTLPALPGKPLLLAPAAGALKVAAAAALSWKKDSAFIDETHLVISVAPDFSSPLLDTVFFDFDSVFQAKGLANDTKYYWRARFENRAGAGPWSDAGSFTTIVRLPDGVTLVFPAPGDTLPADTAKALWHAASPKVDRYWVAVSPDSAFSTQLVDTTVTDTTHLVRYSASAGTYWWRVKAHNDAGWGEFSPKRSFVLKPLANGVLPREFALKTLDFSGGAELLYALPEKARVQIRIFDFAGRLRAFPVDGDQAAGRYSLKLPDLSAGLYYLDFKAGAFRRTQRFAKP